MKFEIDLEAALGRVLSPEVLNPLLDKFLMEAVKDALKDATSWNSDFQKSLKEQLKEFMPHGLQLDEVAKFQHVLNAALTRNVVAVNGNAIHTALEKIAKEVMPEVPEEITVTDLLKECRQGFHLEEDRAFYAYLDLRDDNSGWLYLDSKEMPGVNEYAYDAESQKRLFSREKAKYRAEHCLAFTKDGDVYALKLDGREVTPRTRPDVISHFDSILMSMYVGRTRLKVDISDDDVEHLSNEQEPD